MGKGLYKFDRKEGMFFKKGKKGNKEGLDRSGVEKGGNVKQNRMEDGIFEIFEKNDIRSEKKRADLMRTEIAHQFMVGGNPCETTVCTENLIGTGAGGWSGDYGRKSLDFMKKIKKDDAKYLEGQSLWRALTQTHQREVIKNDYRYGKYKNDTDHRDVLSNVDTGHYGNTNKHLDVSEIQKSEEVQQRYKCDSSTDFVVAELGEERSGCNQDYTPDPRSLAYEFKYQNPKRQKYRESYAYDRSTDQFCGRDKSRPKVSEDIKVVPRAQDKNHYLSPSGLRLSKKRPKSCVQGRKGVFDHPHYEEDAKRQVKGSFVFSKYDRGVGFSEPNPTFIVGNTLGHHGHQL